MQWQEVREQYPHDKWVVIEIIDAHSTNNMRVVDELSVLKVFEDGLSAYQYYQTLHKNNPLREMCVVDVQREDLEIKEHRLIGLLSTKQKLHRASKHGKLANSITLRSIIFH